MGNYLVQNKIVAKHLSLRDPGILLYVIGNFALEVTPLAFFDKNHNKSKIQWANDGRKQRARAIYFTKDA